MAKWTPVDYPVGPLAGPSADADRPAAPGGSGTNLTHPLTLLLRAAGALADVMPAGPAVRPAQPMSNWERAHPPAAPQIRTRLPHVEIEYAPTIPDPNDTAPTGPVPDYGPQGAVPAMPPISPAPPQPAMPVRPMSAPPTAPIAPQNLPPVNDGLFGQFIRAGMRTIPGLAPAEQDRLADIFRLFADKSWRDNSLAGSVVSDYESGRGLLSERMGPDGRMYTPAPDQLPPDQRAIYEERRRAYEANRAEKDSQTAALGKLSPAEQVASIVSSIFGAAASPETAIGPGGGLYAKAGTLGRAAQGAGINAGVMATSDALAQSGAVDRNDRAAFSPAELALSTGGAAALGALIPGIAALFRRAGALRPGEAAAPPPRDTGPPGLDGEIIPPAPPGTPRLAPPESGQPVRSPDMPDTRVRLRDAPAELPAPVRQIEGQRALPAPEEPARPVDVNRQITNTDAPARPAEPATGQAIEPPRAQPEVRVDADGSTIIRLPPPPEKPAKPAVAEAPAVDAAVRPEKGAAQPMAPQRDGRVADHPRTSEVDKLLKKVDPKNESVPFGGDINAPLWIKDKMKRDMERGAKEAMDVNRVVAYSAGGRLPFQPALAKGHQIVAFFPNGEARVFNLKNGKDAPAPSRSSLDNQGTVGEKAGMQQVDTPTKQPTFVGDTRPIGYKGAIDEGRAAGAMGTPPEANPYRRKISEEMAANREPNDMLYQHARDWDSGHVAGRGMPIRAEQPPDVPDFLKRTPQPMKEGPRPAESPVEPVAPKTGNEAFDDWAASMQAKLDAHERALTDPSLEYGAGKREGGALREAARAVAGNPANAPPMPPSRTEFAAKRAAKTARDISTDINYRGKPTIADVRRAAEERSAPPPEAPKGPRLAVDNERVEPAPKAEGGGEGIPRFVQALKPKDEDALGRMTNKALNAEARRVSDLSSNVSKEFIQQGRGHERPSDYLKKNDPLSTTARIVYEYERKISLEKDMRMGYGERRYGGDLPEGGRLYGARIKTPKESPKSPAQSIENRDFASAKLDAKPDSVNDAGPTHPFSKDSKPTEMNLGLPIRATVAKAIGPETIGALVGGGLDHWNEHGYPGLTTRGMIAGAAAVAAIRHRMPGLSKPVFGKASYAKDAIGAVGDAIGRTRAGRWFHPTMGLPKDLWDRIVVQTGVETRNIQEAAKAVAKHIRDNFTPAERALMSDWIERAEQQAAGMNAFRAADARTRAKADELSAKADEIGQRLVDVGMLDKQSYDALKGAYLHRYYLPKQVADPGFREAAKRMQATATYAMRRGESAEFDAKGLKVGDTAVQWTNAQTGNVTYRPAGAVPGPDWFPSKEFKVEAIKDGRAVGHRDYTPAEREAMGEIRDANYRYTMGMMEAARDVSLGSMFKDIAADARWASNAPQPGWVQVPGTSVAGTSIKKWGALAGMHVDPKVWSALDVVRKPWTNTDAEWLNNLTRSYTKMLGLWKIGKTAYNPATHFNNVMGNVSLSMLTGEVTPAYLMRGIGELRKAKRGTSSVVDEAKAAGLSLDREAHLGDAIDNLKADVGIATGMDPRTGWMKFADWYTNNGIVRAYQYEDSIFKIGSYMKNRAEGLSPKDAVAKTHKVFFDYSDVPLGAQFVRDTYSPFFTYTYKYGQLLANIMAEKPWALLAAFGTLTAAHQMSYYHLYGERAKTNADYEAELMPKWLEGRSGFGAPKGIRLPWNEKDTVTGEPRSQFLNSRYMIPGGDFLDFTANGSFGPPVWPQMLGNTILGGNPLVNFAYSVFTGKDSYFDKSIYPYKDPVNAGELAADAATIIRFAAAQALPPILMSVPDKLGNAAVGEGALDKSWMTEAMGWTGTDFAGRQRSVIRAIGSALGVKVEDVNPSENLDFKEAEAKKGDRDANTDVRRAYNNESVTETRRLNLERSAEDRAAKSDAELDRIYRLKKAAGR